MVPLSLRVVLAGVLFAIVACVPSEPPQELRVSHSAKLSNLPPDFHTVKSQRARYSGATFLDFHSRHGTQVEYMAPNGIAFLWYPGNQRVVVGQWKITAPDAGQNYPNICWRYGPETYNPVTKAAGGSFHCTQSYNHIRAEDEYTRGDPFKLASGKIPFVLKKQRYYSFGQLAKRFKVTLSPVE